MKDGTILWDYDTAHEFTAVNGVTSKGGSISNGGPAIVGGMLFVNSGYSHHSGIMPGNVLLAFSANQRLGRTPLPLMRLGTIERAAYCSQTISTHNAEQNHEQSAEDSTNTVAR